MRAKVLNLIGLSALMLIAGTSAVAQPEPPDEPPIGDPRAGVLCEGDEEVASYQLRFEATWSEETHPTAFPPNPHFSGLIGAAHSDEFVMWEEGGIATPGIENMAETGGKSPLNVEIETATQMGTAEFLISGAGISPSPGSTSEIFDISIEQQLVSVVSMIAPSPDWFVGVNSLALCDEDGWRDQVIVELLPWDAGTDSGLFYTSLDSDTTPQEPIVPLTGTPVEVDGEVPPFGTFTFTRMIGDF